MTTVQILQYSNICGSLLTTTKCLHSLLSFTPLESPVPQDPRIPCTPGSPVPQNPLYPRIPCTPGSPVPQDPLCLLICKTSLTQGWLTLGSELTSSNYHRENYLAYFQKEEDLLLGTKEEIENLRPKTPPPKTRGTGRGRGMGRGGMGRGELFRH